MTTNTETAMLSMTKVIYLVGNLEHCISICLSTILDLHIGSTNQDLYDDDHTPDDGVSGGNGDEDDDLVQRR